MYCATLGPEAFTDFDYADDIALPSKMLSLLLSALEVFVEEAALVGLTPNWKKTKIQSVNDFLPPACRISQSLESRSIP